MRKRAMRATVLGAVVAAGVIGAASLAMAQAASLSAEESRWLDRRISEQERAILDTIVGHAPPEFTPDLRWLESDRMTLEGLRGKVVVIQSWTRKTVLGRAAPTRTAHVLKGFGPDDVRIIALHTPEGAEGVDAYMDRREMDVPVAVDAKGAYCDELGVYDRPITILLDRQGAVRYAGVSILGLPPAVEKLVDEEYQPDAPKPSVVASRDSRDAALGAAAPPGAPAAREGDGDFPPFQGRINGAVDFRGRKGPELFAQQWFTGEPNPEGKVVVAEFWATWCGPCRKSIPHMNQLQAAFPNEVLIAGISDEPPPKVGPAVKQLNMQYTVGTDPTRRMRAPIRIQGIPHAIVMSPDGIVRWQGHPATLSEDVLRQIVRASNIGATAGSGAGRHRWTGA